MWSTGVAGSMVAMMVHRSGRLTVAMTWSTGAAGSMVAMTWSTGAAGSTVAMPGPPERPAAVAMT